MLVAFLDQDDLIESSKIFKYFEDLTQNQNPLMNILLFDPKIMKDRKEKYVIFS